LLAPHGEFLEAWFVSRCFRAWGKSTYSRDREEHNDQLLLAKHGVPDERVQEPGKAAPPFFYEGAIVG
jgi:hypothetical protein